MMGTTFEGREGGKGARGGCMDKRRSAPRGKPGEGKPGGDIARAVRGRGGVGSRMRRKAARAAARRDTHAKESGKEAAAVGTKLAQRASGTTTTKQCDATTKRDLPSSRAVALLEHSVKVSGLREVARGSFGRFGVGTTKVRCSTGRVLDTLVGVKWPRPGQQISKVEVDALKSLGDTGVVPVFLGHTSVATKEGALRGIVMEYLEKSLCDVWADVPSSSTEQAHARLVWLEEGLVRILQCLHVRGVVHGDLSPSNLRVKTRPGTAVDFVSGSMKLVAVDMGMSGKGWEAGTWPYKVSAWFSESPFRTNGGTAQAFCAFEEGCAIDTFQAGNVLALFGVGRAIHKQLKGRERKLHAVGDSWVAHGCNGGWTRWLQTHPIDCCTIEVHQTFCNGLSSENPVGRALDRLLDTKMSFLHTEPMLGRITRRGAGGRGEGRGGAGGEG